MMDDYKIRESIHGNFYYHISLDDKPLCGEKHTMVTSIPIKAWGIVSHLHERYCKKCEALCESNVATLEELINCLSPENGQKVLDLIQESQDSLGDGIYPEIEAQYAFIKRNIKRYLDEKQRTKTISY